jgi:hypothetical protein
MQKQKPVNKGAFQTSVQLAAPPLLPAVEAGFYFGHGLPRSLAIVYNLPLSQHDKEYPDGQSLRRNH